MSRSSSPSRIRFLSLCRDPMDLICCLALRATRSGRSRWVPMSSIDVRKALHEDPSQLGTTETIQHGFHGRRGTANARGIEYLPGKLTSQSPSHHSILGTVPLLDVHNILLLDGFLSARTLSPRTRRRPKAFVETDHPAHRRRPPLRSSSPSPWPLPAPSP